MDIAPDIELTDAERMLIAAIDADSPEYETRIASFARVRQVMELLVKRGAIPEARLPVTMLTASGVRVFDVTRHIVAAPFALT